MNGKVETRKAFYATWLTGTVIFGIIMTFIMTRDGGLDTAKMVVGSIVVCLVGGLLALHLKKNPH